MIPSTARLGSVWDVRSVLWLGGCTRPVSRLRRPLPTPPNAAAALGGFSTRKTGKPTAVARALRRATCYTFTRQREAPQKMGFLQPLSTIIAPESVNDEWTYLAGEVRAALFTASGNIRLTADPAHRIIVV